MSTNFFSDGGQLMVEICRTGFSGCIHYTQTLLLTIGDLFTSLIATRFENLDRIKIICQHYNTRNLDFSGSTFRHFAIHSMLLVPFFLPYAPYAEQYFPGIMVSLTKADSFQIEPVRML